MATTKKKVAKVESFKPADVPGSESETPIEQQMDMIEDGSGPHGDEILFTHGADDGRDRTVDRDPQDADEVIERFEMDMSEDNREGDEMSGDDHSSGLQGGEQEMENQPNIESGLPGDAIESEKLNVREMQRRKVG